MQKYFLFFLKKMDSMESSLFQIRGFIHIADQIMAKMTVLIENLYERQYFEVNLPRQNNMLSSLAFLLFETKFLTTGCLIS